MELDPTGILLVAGGALLSLFGMGAAIAVAIGSLVFFSTAVVSLPALDEASITVL
jgi:hypothetical protein